MSVIISKYHYHYHIQIAGQYIVFWLMYQIFEKRKSRKNLYVMYSSYKSEEAA